MTHALRSRRGRTSSSAETAPIALRRILWACDLAPGSTRALQLVIPIARAYGSVITALHVLPTVPPSDGPESLTSPALGLSHLRHDAAVSLDRLVVPAVVASVPTRITLREGNPAEEILDLAARLPADLIALRTHRRSALRAGGAGNGREGDPRRRAIRGARGAGRGGAGLRDTLQDRALGDGLLQPRWRGPAVCPFAGREEPCAPAVAACRGRPHLQQAGRDRAGARGGGHGSRRP